MYLPAYVLVMMKRNVVRAIMLAGLIALALLEPAAVTAAARQACRVWAESVMPALFPFVTLSLLLVSSLNAWDGADALLTGLTIALGMLGGSPSGARLLAQRAADGRLSRRTAQCAAACITTASPMFILAALTNWLGGGRSIGLTMLAAHELAALLTGAVCLSWTRRWPDVIPANSNLNHNSTTKSADHAIQMTKSKPLSLGEAVTQAASAMLTVCGCMMIFSAAVAVAVKRLSLPESSAAILAAILEMAGGSARIAALGWPIVISAPIICAVVTFGGCSVFAQNASFLSKAGVRIEVQLAARVVAGALAWALCSGMLGNRWGWVAASGILVAASCVRAEYRRILPT